MIVKIPSCQEHAGYPGNVIKVEISDLCPRCGKPRGKPFSTISYDGSRRLHVDGWENECEHVDRYSEIREGITSGVNKIVRFDTPTTLEQTKGTGI